MKGCEPNVEDAGLEDEEPNVSNSARSDGDRRLKSVLRTSAARLLSRSGLEMAFSAGPGGRMVIPVDLPEAQQLVAVDKDLNGRVTTKEIMRVLFSLLEDRTSPHSARPNIQRLVRGSTRLPSLQDRTTSFNVGRLQMILLRLRR